jgi:hypothetical protein
MQAAYITGGRGYHMGRVQRPRGATLGHACCTPSPASAGPLAMFPSHACRAAEFEKHLHRLCCQKPARGSLSLSSPDPRHRAFLPLACPLSPWQLAPTRPSPSAALLLLPPLVHAALAAAAEVGFLRVQLRVEAPLAREALGVDLRPLRVALLRGGVGVGVCCGLRVCARQRGRMRAFRGWCWTRDQGRPRGIAAVHPEKPPAKRNAPSPGSAGGQPRPAARATPAGSPPP